MREEDILDIDGRIIGEVLTSLCLGDWLSTRDIHRTAEGTYGGYISRVTVLRILHAGADDRVIERKRQWAPHRDIQYWRWVGEDA